MTLDFDDEASTNESTEQMSKLLRGVLLEAVKQDTKFIFIRTPYDFHRERMKWIQRHFNELGKENKITFAVVREGIAFEQFDEKKINRLLDIFEEKDQLVSKYIKGRFQNQVTNESNQPEE